MVRTVTIIHSIETSSFLVLISELIKFFKTWTFINAVFIPKYCQVYYNGRLCIRTYLWWPFSDQSGTVKCKSASWPMVNFIPGLKFHFVIASLSLSDNVDEVITLVFQYLNMLKHEGFQQWIFEEQRVSFPRGIKALVLYFSTSHVIVSDRRYPLKSAFFDNHQQYYTSPTSRLHWASIRRPQICKHVCATAWLGVVFG